MIGQKKQHSREVNNRLSRQKTSELKLELGIDKPRVSSAKKTKRLLEPDQVKNHSSK